MCAAVPIQHLASHGITLSVNVISHMLVHKIAVDNISLLNRWHMCPVDHNFEFMLVPVANSHALSNTMSLLTVAWLPRGTYIYLELVR